MTSKADRFWIKFILRFAFGFLFLVAAINIFSYGGAHDFGPDKFARDLSKPYTSQTHWLADLPKVDIGTAATPAKKKDGKVIEPAKKAEKDIVHPTYFFLVALPFLFAALSVPILTGIFLAPALRIGAVLMILLGLGKYMASPGDLSTTANDFFFAFLICVGLYFLGQEKREVAEEL